MLKPGKEEIVDHKLEVPGQSVQFSQVKITNDKNRSRVSPQLCYFKNILRVATDDLENNNINDFILRIVFRDLGILDMFTRETKQHVFVLTHLD